MKKKYTYILLPLLVFFMTGCNSEDDNEIVLQRDRIISYLETNMSSSYDYKEISGVFRYRIPDLRVPDTNENRIENGDSVYFRYAAYQFTTSRVEPAFFTNIEYIIDEYPEGLNTIFFSREPEKVKIGKSKLIKPIETGLIDCHKGDSVMLFLTKNMAFGSNYMMSLPKDSAVEYAILIDEVIKQQ